MPDKIPPAAGEIITPVPMEEVMHASMMPYAEYVILERALPRVEDGLKPVQRRILYTMHELGITPEKPYKKSARVVGDALGKYHPHGDTSVYDAMVRMAQPFNMSAPLVDGHGNFGSVDGDSPAAMRYTEVRMTPLALELLRDIESDSVNFSLNFDDSLKEPDVLPGRFPNLLVNGASGIAVGLATNIPPHNLNEAIAAVIAQLDNPDIPLPELLKLMPGPDFPTGGYLLGTEGLSEAYETGRGKLTVRAKTGFETLKNGRKLIVVSELPYQVNKVSLLEKILAVTQEKKLLFAGVTDIRDESDRQGMRAVIELRKDADEQKILQYLFKYTDLQQSFGVNMVAIACGKPMQLGLKGMIAHYIEHQRSVVLRRTRHELDQAQRREHILAGLMIAIDQLDAVIALIRASRTPKQAREGLTARFALTEPQAQAILDLRLQRLTGLEMLAIQKEHREILALIGRLEEILNSEAKLRGVIKRELRDISARFPQPRRSFFLDESPEIRVEEEPKIAEDAYISVLESGGLLRQSKKNAKPTGGERAVFSLETQTGKKIWLFTNHGALITLAVDDIAPGVKPALLSSLAELEEGETVVSAMLPAEDGELLFYTGNGMIKRTAASEYFVRARKAGAIALKDDALLSVEKKNDESILLVTRQGMSLRTDAASIPSTGRMTGGVRGIRLDTGDRVLFAAQVPEEGELLVISDMGYMKRSFIFDYELQGRNGKGLKTFDFKKNGSNGRELAAIFHVSDPFLFTVEQKHGGTSVFSTEQIYLEPRLSKGQPGVTVLLDDYVVRAYPSAEKEI